MADAIVVFDGECGLCNAFVAWLIPRDKRGAFLITGSGGPVGRAVLEAAGVGPEVADSTIVVWDGSTTELRSRAVLTIARGLSAPWRAVSAIARIVPRGLADRVYDAVAARRPRSPGGDPACGVPPERVARRWRERLASLSDVGALEIRSRPGP